MQLSNATLSSAAICALFCAPALAQTRYCIGGELDHLSQAERVSCSSKLQAVHAVASELHAPSDWHFVVVCGEEGWKEYVAYTMDSTGALQKASADTNFEARETFIREDRLDLHDHRSLKVVVAHEVAGILLHSKDEAVIDKQVKLWVPEDGNVQGF